MIPILPISPIHRLLLTGLLLALPALAAETRLDELDPESAVQGWGALQTGSSVQGNPLSIAGRQFQQGLGTHANSEIVYDLAGLYTNFSAWVGVDDDLKNHPEGPKASVVFQVFVDGAKRFDSGVMKLGEAAKPVNVPVAGVDELKLVVADAGDGVSCDHANWAEAKVSGKVEGGDRKVEGKTQEIKANGIAVRLDADGRLVECTAGGQEWALSGQTKLRGFQPAGTVTAEGSTFTRTMTNAAGQSCTVTDRFTAEGEAVRWDIAITSQDPNWTAPIISQLAFGRPDRRRVWGAWGATAQGAWSDPLVPIAFLTRNWHYGNVAQSCPLGNDFVSLPLMTVLDPAAGSGISLVPSPDDVLLNLDWSVTASGRLRLSRLNHRLGGGQPVRFTMHLVAHESSWRGGLRFMTQRYPQFFDPPNPRVHELAGCGAYSTGEQEIDVPKFRKMAFGFNWKLSDDFPYMGMFIPPVKDMDEKWERSCDEGSAAYKGRFSSCRQMNDYAGYMKTNGFAVLSYFNVTEFGKNMYGRQPVRPADDPELWKDPAAYIKYRLPTAIVDPNIGTCYRAYIVDVGDPGYQAFMLEQAERNTKMLPNTAGICIDRMDWLTLYNRHADDGVSWVEGKPARSLFRSWGEFASKLGPQLHAAGKAIFGNPHSERLETVKELDGIYTEFGQNGNALNTSAFLGLRKPVVCWTYNETLAQPGPDAFMQRHLHMGCFPTAPYPHNNHCINPEPKADQLYGDYGPLLSALRGKTWVLEPRCVESDTAKVNLFKVPGGYALPVTFGGETATVCVRGVGNGKCEAIQPGVEKPVPLTGTVKDGVLELTVPLVRGCAMVRIADR